MFRRGEPYQDPDSGHWIAVWWVGDHRYEEDTGSAKRTDVDAVLTTKEEAFDQSKATWSGRQVTTTVTAAKDRFLADKADLAAKTLRQYRSVLHNFEAFYGDKPITSLSSQDVNRFLKAHKADGGVSVATLAADLRVLKALANWCKDEGLRQHAFTDGVKRIRVPRKRKRYLDQRVIARFINACSPTFRPIALFLILTGLRMKEMINAEWDHIEQDADGRWVLWLTGAKTEDDRCVPLHPVLVDELNKLERISKYIFPVTQTCHNPGGRNCRRGDRRSQDTSWLNKCAKKAAEAAGLDPKKIDLHGLRKTYGRLVQKHGNDIWLTARLLGHTEINTTQHHYLFDDMDRAHEAVCSIDLGLDGPDDPAEDQEVAADKVIDFAERRRKRLVLQR